MGSCAKGTKGIKVTATAANLSSEARRTGLRSSSLTPSAYRIAMVNFWLTKSDGTEVSILNPEGAEATYTEANPLIVDFTSGNASKEILELAAGFSGSFTGYKMQLLYLEMELPVAFHLPTGFETSGVAGFEGVASILDESLMRRLRLYFNSHGKYWKRDFVVELEPGTGEWYWLRRAVENSSGVRNFFIPVDSNDHPVGGSAPTSTIDLFNDEEFWGSEDDLDSSVDPIIVGTHSTAGGVNATLTGTLEIPAELDGFYNIDLQIDVANTMNYEALAQSSAAAGVTVLADVLDLGPSHTSGNYSDIGLHPFLPTLTVVTTKSDADTKATVESSFQVPQTCIDEGWSEPAVCTTNYCPTHAEDAFCVAIAD